MRISDWSSDVCSSDLGTNFFTNDFGGSAMMYVNLIWIWGHPEVYILILPLFGVFSEVPSTFSGKKLFGYTSMVYATVCITILRDRKRVVDGKSVSVRVDLGGSRIL